MARPKADYTEIDNFILANHSSMTRPKIAENLSCSLATVQRRFQALQETISTQKPKEYAKPMERFIVTYCIDGIQLTKEVDACNSKSAIAGVKKWAESQSYDELNSIEMIGCKKVPSKNLEPKQAPKEDKTLKLEKFIDPVLEYDIPEPKPIKSEPAREKFVIGFDYQRKEDKQVPKVKSVAEEVVTEDTNKNNELFEQHWRGAKEVMQQLNAQLEVDKEETTSQQIDTGTICYTSDKEICISTGEEFISLGTGLTYKLINFIHELFPAPVGGRKMT